MGVQYDDMCFVCGIDLLKCMRYVCLCVTGPGLSP